MCFYIHPKHREMKTAKRDIVCYKEGYRHQEEIFLPKYHGEYVYRLGQLNKIVGEWPKRLPWEHCSKINIIHEGFHSFSNKKCLSRRYGRGRVKCIIPKGAHYFYNPGCREYVSDQIIVQEFI